MNEFLTNLWDKLDFYMDFAHDGVGCTHLPIQKLNLLLKSESWQFSPLSKWGPQSTCSVQKNIYPRQFRHAWQLFSCLNIGHPGCCPALNNYQMTRIAKCHLICTLLGTFEIGYQALLCMSAFPGVQNYKINWSQQLVKALRYCFQGYRWC